MKTGLVWYPESVYVCSCLISLQRLSWGLYQVYIPLYYVYLTMCCSHYCEKYLMYGHYFWITECQKIMSWHPALVNQPLNFHLRAVLNYY